MFSGIASSGGVQRPRRQHVPRCPHPFAVAARESYNRSNVCPRVAPIRCARRRAFGFGCAIRSGDDYPAVNSKASSERCLEFVNRPRADNRRESGRRAHRGAAPPPGTAGAPRRYRQSRHDIHNNRARLSLWDHQRTFRRNISYP